MNCRAGRQTSVRIRTSNQDLTKTNGFRDLCSLALLFLVSVSGAGCAFKMASGIPTEDGFDVLTLTSTPTSVQPSPT